LRDTSAALGAGAIVIVEDERRRVAAEGALGEPDWLVVPGGAWKDRVERGGWGEG
jgi:hypothetical protein